MNLDESLRSFYQQNKMHGKGPLCLALVITRRAKAMKFPLRPDNLLTQAKGQVVGMGKSAVQAILNDYGIQRVLAEEGGRTSRGSVDKMRKYAAFLNNLHSKNQCALDFIENWWIARVKEYFAGKPFRLHFDTSKSLRAIIHDLLEQAQRRQTEFPGATLAGTMLQHLVGAKLNLVLGKAIKHYGASVKDESSGREGDFLIEDVAIHVTTMPSEALLRKCGKNLEQSLKPVIITTSKGALVAESLAEQQGFIERLDVFEAEQFLAGNLYEIGKFGQSGRRTTAEHLIKEYNRIIDQCETDPSLKIELA